MNRHQELAIRALGNMKGDDSARARRAFSNYTPEMMQQEYGQRGKTCAAILAEYESSDAEIDAAICWVNGLKV